LFVKTEHFEGLALYGFKIGFSEERGSVDFQRLFSLEYLVVLSEARSFCF